MTLFGRVLSPNLSGKLHRSLFSGEKYVQRNLRPETCAGFRRKSYGATFNSAKPIEKLVLSPLTLTGSHPMART